MPLISCPIIETKKVKWKWDVIGDVQVAVKVLVVEYVPMVVQTVVLGDVMVHVKGIVKEHVKVLAVQVVVVIRINFGES